MPRNNVFAGKSDEALAMEYAIRTPAAGTAPPPPKLYASIDIWDEMVRRQGHDSTVQSVDKARETLRLMGD